MKKLSIVLAIIMALSCFCFTAFAAVGDDCNYTALNKALAEADIITDTSKYTEDSVKAFETALANAKAIEKNLKVDAAGENQPKIDVAATALEAAIKKLEKKPGPCDYTALDEALEEAAAITDTTKYTEDSAKAFAKALKAAKAIERDLKVDDAGKNQKSIDAAAKALTEAIEGLKEYVKVNVKVVAKDFEGFDLVTGRFPYVIEFKNYTVGSTIKAEDIINLAKAKVDSQGNKIIDPEEYVVSKVVVLKDVREGVSGTDDNDGTEVTTVTLGNDRPSYDFILYIYPINHVENLAQVAATELGGKVDWKGIASANTGLINQVINGAKAAADSLAKADYPEIGEKKTEDAANKSAGSVKGDKVVMTPKTGASAAAGVAVVVLALSATTAVVLRKKED